MADITMCRNRNCLKKHMCYRYNAVPNEVQAYDNFSINAQFCFISMKGRKDVKETKKEVS